MTIKSDIIDYIAKKPGITTAQMASHLEDLGYFSNAATEKDLMSAVSKHLDLLRKEGHITAESVRINPKERSKNVWSVVTTIPPAVAISAPVEAEPETEMASDVAELWAPDTPTEPAPAPKYGWEPEWSPQCATQKDVKTEVQAMADEIVAAIKPLSAAMIYAGWLDNQNLDPVAFLAGIVFAENSHGIH